MEKYPLLRRILPYPTLSRVLGYTVLARNVQNVQEIEKFVNSLRAPTPAIQRWLKSNLRNYLINDYESAEPYSPKSSDPDWMHRGEIFRVNLQGDLKDQMDHVVDYLKSASAPADLTRLSVLDAIKKADLWLENLTKGPAAEQVPGEIEIKRYPDGFGWMKLTSSEALDREGKLMKHCVGDYSHEIESGTEIYSLRDPENGPHCTVQVTDGEIQQIKGKTNKEVNSKYHPYVKDFIDTTGFKMGSGGSSDLTKAGLISIDGKIYGLDSVETWPKEIQGNLNLYGTPITRLPLGLTVGGNLNLYGTPIAQLPQGLQVGGDLNLYGTPIAQLPQGL